MATDQNKLCSVINKTGKDIVLALTISDDETTSQNAVISANQQLEILKTSAGSTVIKNGSSDTVILDHNYKAGAGEIGYVQDYNLIVSDSNWLYPIADLPVVQQGTNGSAAYAPQTVDVTNQAPMTQAFDFYQTFSVYPSSQLATDYMNTLLQTQKAVLAKADGGPGSAKAVTDAIENAIGLFFKGTEKYKDVTLPDIVAVDNYYNNFPFVWAQYKDSITYYLYATDGITAVFAGTLSLNKVGAVDITKSNGGYTCSFAPATNAADTSKTDVDASKSVNLTYSAGFFWDDPTAAAPNIGLKGNFQLERLFTNDPNDNNVISVLAGRVNGMTCIGFDIPQSSAASLKKSSPTALASTPVEKYWNTLVHPKSQQDLIVSILTLVGAILVIPATAFAIYGIYRIVKYKQQAKEPAVKVEIESIQVRLTETQRAKIIRDYIRMSGSADGDDFDTLDDQQILKLKGFAETIQNMKNRVQLEDAFRLQETCLQEALRYSAQLDSTIVKLIQQSLKSIRDTIYLDFWDAKFSDLGSLLPKAYEKFSTVQANLEKISTAVNHYLDNDQKELMANNIKDGATIYERIQTLNEKNTEEEAEVDPEIREEIKPLFE